MSAAPAEAAQEGNVTAPADNAPAQGMLAPTHWEVLQLVYRTNSFI